MPSSNNDVINNKTLVTTVYLVLRHAVVQRPAAALASAPRAAWQPHLRKGGVWCAVVQGGNARKGPEVAQKRVVGLQGKPEEGSVDLGPEAGQQGSVNLRRVDVPFHIVLVLVRGGEA